MCDVTEEMQVIESDGFVVSQRNLNELDVIIKYILSIQSQFCYLKTPRLIFRSEMNFKA